MLQTLIRAYFSPAATTGQRYIYSGSADGAVYIWGALHHINFLGFLGFHILMIQHDCVHKRHCIYSGCSDGSVCIRGARRRDLRSWMSMFLWCLNRISRASPETHRQRFCKN